jgi:hypothetical protein
VVPLLVVVLDVPREDVAQVPLAEGNHKVGAFLTYLGGPEQDEAMACASDSPTAPYCVRAMGAQARLRRFNATTARTIVGDTSYGPVRSELCGDRSLLLRRRRGRLNRLGRRLAL